MLFSSFFLLPLLYVQAPPRDTALPGLHQVPGKRLLTSLSGGGLSCKPRGARVDGDMLPICEAFVLGVEKDLKSQN